VTDPLLILKVLAERKIGSVSAQNPGNIAPALIPMVEGAAIASHEQPIVVGLTNVLRIRAESLVSVGSVARRMPQQS